MGYVKAKSVPSVIAGAGCGLIALVLGYYYDACPYVPYAVLVLNLVLIFMMGRRYLRTRNPMPALLVVVLSIIIAAAQVYILFVSGAGRAS